MAVEHLQKKHVEHISKFHPSHLSFSESRLKSSISAKLPAESDALRRFASRSSTLGDMESCFLNLPRPSNFFGGDICARFCIIVRYNTQFRTSYMLKKSLNYLVRAICYNSSKVS